MRSDMIKRGFERAPHRSLLRATGLKDEDFDKPFIGVANSFIEIIPGHFFLNKVSEIIKEEIRANGCVPFESNTIGVDDGIAMGHDGMLYSLPSREIIADSIETVMNAHKLDAMIAIPNCDKIVPGMIMGALRVNVPTVFVSGGPMAKGYSKNGEPIDLATVFEGVGKFESGEITADDLSDLECNACPSGGSCSGMFTANSMNTLMEAMGIALSGNGTILALTKEREELYRKAAKRVCELAKMDMDEKEKLELDGILSSTKENLFEEMKIIVETIAKELKIPMFFIERIKQNEIMLANTILHPFRGAVFKTLNKKNPDEFGIFKSCLTLLL